MPTAANEKPLPSPCVHICALNEQDICIGCRRHAQEIQAWPSLTNPERQQVLVACRQRAQAQRL